MLHGVATSFLNASSFPPTRLVLPLSLLFSELLVPEHVGVGGIDGFGRGLGLIFDKFGSSQHCNFDISNGSSPGTCLVDRTR